MKQIERIPFFRLLLPLLAGIVLQYYIPNHKWSIIPLLTGLVVMLFSYLIPQKKQFDLRWLFGAGLFLFLFSVGTISTQIRQQLSAYTFPDTNRSYNGIITDIPQEKPNTFAYRVNIEELNKKIICYIPKDENSKTIQVGDNILFFSKIELFESKPTSEGFNYANYIYNKGYAGYTFVLADRWEKTNKKTSSVFIKATQCRQKILRFYQTLGLDKNEYAILSAITLGYKDSLSDDLTESFRATGTAHILAISGMHVGIIYLVLLSLFSIFLYKPNHIWIRGIIIISLLWGYAFIIGFPPSAVRACIMLTLFSIAELKGMKTYTINTLLATAFLMLVWNPFWLFDLGFQLSFIAVLSMLLLLPFFSKKKYIRNKYLRYFSNILLVSLVVQIGTFPLCLYYFGTFPTYFFLTNLLIIPLVTLIIYDTILILASSILGILFPQISNYLNFIFINTYKYLVSSITQTAHFFENLPCAQIQDINITLISLILLWSITILLISFNLKKKAWFLTLTLICGFMLLSTSLWERISNKNTLHILNKPQGNHITHYNGYQKNNFVDIKENKLLSLKGKNYLILTHDLWKDKHSESKFDVDYLHIIGDNSISIYSLNNKFNIRKVILDSSLSTKSLKRFVSECEKLRIPYYDVSKNGFLRIFF